MSRKRVNSLISSVAFLVLVFAFSSNLRAEDDLGWRAREQLKRQIQLDQRKLAELIQEEIEFKEQQEGLMQQRQELKIKLEKILRSVVQEKAMAEIMLKKQLEEKARLKKIDRLWQRARRLYRIGVYEEAIKIFEEIIALERGE